MKLKVLFAESNQMFNADFGEIERTFCTNFGESNQMFNADFGELNYVRGKSDYEIALDHGFVGTEEEWLDSLRHEVIPKDYGKITYNQDRTIIVS